MPILAVTIYQGDRDRAMDDKLILSQFNKCEIIREGGDIRLFITLVPKVLYKRFLIHWPNNFGTFNEF